VSLWSGPFTEATTIGDLLLRSAAQRGGCDAVVFPGDRRTYGELRAGAIRVARGLHALGVRRGDHVGILMANCPDYVEAFFGISLLGAVIVPINARYKSYELSYVIENADLAVLLTGDIVAEHVDFVALLHEALPGLAASPDPTRLAVPGAARLRSVVLLGRHAAAGMIDRKGFEALAAAVTDQTIATLRELVRLRDIALMVYTSGTTASPKGCPHTHEGIVRNTAAAGERFGIGPADTLWDPLPMFHMSALTPLLFTIGAGATFVSMTHFEAAAAVRQMQEEAATLIYPCFPPVMTALMAEPAFGQADLSAVRVMLNVAPLDTLQLMAKAVPGAAQIGSYGVTEAGGVVSYNDYREADHERQHTVGRPLRGLQVRIVSPDGLPLPAGQRGELLVRGHSVIDGYYKDPQRSAEVIDAEGWFHSGDLCQVDGDGRIAFLGRLKEMLKVGGENVAPAEIESYLSTHPAVRMVQAVGIPDERLVEVPAAFVELKPGMDATEQDLIDFCRGRIASYKVPRHVRFLREHEWPMSATKVQRFRLRDRLLAELESG